MMEETLGCGDAQFVILDRCGGITIGDLTDDMSSITYGRTLDDVSQVAARITLAASGDSGCCEVVSGLRSWIHSAVVLRNGKLVWGPGPVYNTLENRNSVQIIARDVFAWLDKRLVRTDLIFEDVPVLQVVKALVDHAMALDDPCGVADLATYLPLQPGEPETLISRTFSAGRMRVGDAIRELARTSVDFTCVGAGLVFGQTMLFGPYGTLTDDDFAVDLEIEERGSEAATRWQINGNGTKRASAGGIDPFYGLLEEIDNDVDVESQSEVEAEARGRVAASNPVPVYVNVPDRARLSASSPVTIEKLVPGAVLGVSLQNYCRQVDQQMRLTNLSVEIGNDSDEEVGITLSPVGINYGEAGGFE